jgi:cellobiose-specific phosphotransferase system component IIA
MKLKHCLVGMGLIAMLAVSQAFAADPSMHQVYEAAESGHVAQAQEMMQEVLKAHPNSAKAHYVEAELLSKQHSYAQARTELASAERLSPGLNFADARSVSELREALAQNTRAAPLGSVAQQTPAGSASFPWGIILLGCAVVVAFIFFLIRFLATRATPAMAPAGNAYGGNAYGAYATPQPMGSYGGAYPAQPASGGSGILGSLATGAAIGAGVVAGEALMDRVLGGNHERQPDRLSDASTGGLNLGPDEYANNDMGGQDFGISDTGWDDQSFGSSSSDDWS